MSDEKKLSLPGEWALQKTLEPVLGEMGQDIKGLYAMTKQGASLIIVKAYRKIFNKKDGKKVNLRVARDVFWNGATSEEAICAEYFGGILASSRSEDGKDDSGIHYVDVIKSLSSKQLHLHYVIYNLLNNIFVNQDKKINVGQEFDLSQESLWFSSEDLINSLGLNVITFETDLNVLYRQGLLKEYKIDFHILENQRQFSYIMVKPTIFGVLLYAIGHNKLSSWRKFAEIDFGDFEDIVLPQLYSNQSFSELIK